MHFAFREPDVPEFDLWDGQERLREKIQMYAHLSLLCTYCMCSTQHALSDWPTSIKILYKALYCLALNAAEAVAHKYSSSKQA